MDEIYGPAKLSKEGEILATNISKDIKTKLIILNRKLGTSLNWHSNFLGGNLRKLIKDPEIKKAIKLFTKDTKDTKYKIWRSNVFYKKKGKEYKGVDWHHDKHFQDSNKKIDFNELGDHLSILIAISDITKETGIFRYIPNSSTKARFIERNEKPYHLKSKKEHFAPLDIDIDYQSVSKELPIMHGTFIIFHSSLIHGSAPAINTKKGRIGLVIRLVKENKEVPKILLRGSKTLNF